MHISASGSFIHRKSEHKVGASAASSRQPSCSHTEMRKVDPAGQWCEDTCIDSTGPVASVLGLQAGNCPQLGYTKLVHSIVGDVFVPSSCNTYPELIFHAEYPENECKMHHNVNQVLDVCESFCTSDGKGLDYSQAANAK